MQEFSPRWDAVRAVIQPFVHRQSLLNILTKTSLHCLSFREIKWSFIYSVLCSLIIQLRFDWWTQDVGALITWSCVCVGGGGGVLVCNLSPALDSEGNRSVGILIRHRPKAEQTQKQPSQIPVEVQQPALIVRYSPAKQKQPVFTEEISQWITSPVLLQVKLPRNSVLLNVVHLWLKFRFTSVTSHDDSTFYGALYLRKY